MKKPYFKRFVTEGLRTQPWTTAERDENERYYNFRSNPELISKVLEDYKPWDRYKAVQQFYELVAWVNSEDSRFESNDAAFKGPSENFQRDTFLKALVCSGRLMFFFRNLRLNLSVDSRTVDYTRPDYTLNLFFEWLERRSLQSIERVHQETEWACSALEIYPVLYNEAPVNQADRFGHQISYKFWAWGDDETGS